MTSYRPGFVDEAQGIDLPNDSADYRICTLYNYNHGKVMKCKTSYVEYCNCNGQPHTFPGFPEYCTEENTGAWAHTYTTEEVLALDPENCPEPPVDFCQTNPLLGRRELEQDTPPCPFAAHLMN